MATLKNTTVLGTGAATLPSGTTAQRPSVSTSGMMRVNTSLGNLENYNNAWDQPTSIVTSSLAVHYDAGNTSSYPGSGSTWNDISGNARHMTVVGATQTPFVTVEGVSCFQANGIGYWSTTTPAGQAFYTGNGGTVEFWFYYIGIQPRRTIIEKSGTSYASYQQEFAFTVEVSGNLSTYRKGGQSGTYDYSSLGPFIQNGWNHVCVMLEPNAGGGWGIFNGGPRNYKYTSRDSVNLPLQSGALTVLYGYAGVVDQGYLSTVRVYTKVLTDAEVYQNFKFERTRYKI